MKRKNEIAFTYIELIVVAIIFGILVGLSIPQFKKTSAYLELENLAKNIYLLCNYLQSDSISKAKIYSLNFSIEAKEFKPYFLNADGQWKLLRGRLSKSYKVPDKITLEITPAEKNNVFFYPDGSSEDLMIIFKNEFEYRRVLVIKGITGEIKIQ